MVPVPTDDTAYTNYTRTYTYDEAGNLTQVRHSPATGSGYTTKITLSDRSNRGVLSTLAENPADVDAQFTADGQQTQLQPGQKLIWTARNELLKVTPVVRAGGTDDSESYRYDGGSQRLLKVSVQKTGNSTQTQRVQYLAGLELRSTKTGETETESLQVISVGESGRAQVRVLHWESGRPEGISNDQLRYSYDNIIGSSSLELDGDGNIISTEEYYPYGGTAVWTARSAVEANYKTVRYSGKERDATGLYYYGYRYYQPWAGRWLSADPAGTVDGMNLFRMCRNNPILLQDNDGRAPGIRYVYFPFMHEERIFRLAQANIIRNNKGKEDLIVLVNGNDPNAINDFDLAVHKFFLDHRGVKLLEQQGDLQERIYNKVTPGLSSTIQPEDHVIINAHGMPAVPDFYSDADYSKSMFSPEHHHVSASSVAKTLVHDFNLPETTIVKVSTCHSAEGNEEGISIPSNIRKENKLLRHVINNKGDFSRSLAGNLEAELMKLQPGRQEGNVYGYLGETTFYAHPSSKISVNDNSELTESNVTTKLSVFGVQDIKGFLCFGYTTKKSEHEFRRSLTRTSASGSKMAGPHI